MKQRMGMDQELSNKQAIEQAQQNRLEQRQFLTMRLRESPYAPEKVADNVVDQAIKRLPDSVRDTIRTFFASAPGLGQQMVKEADTLIRPTPEAIDRLIAQYVWEQADGEFVLHEESDAGIHMTKAQYHLGIFSPEDLRTEQTLLRDFIAEDPNSTTVLETYRQVNHALRVGEVIREHYVEAYRTPIHLLFSAKDVYDQPIMTSFLRETVLVEQYLPEISDRVFRRIEDRCTKMRQTETAASFRNAMLNAISEVSLISLGIISPELFQLHSVKSARGMMEETAEQDLQKKGFSKQDIDRAKAELKAQGVFFQRWKTRNVPTSGNTEHIISTFRTKILREDADALLDAIQYENGYFDRLKYASMQCRIDGQMPTAKQREEGGEAFDTLSELLHDALMGEALHETIQRLSKEKWMDVLADLY